ncbi:Lon protease-like protein: peroxisomal [Dinothrombium tinctorium]|uniref:Lon protease homolog n=1 Tax=Dinothrombium tinctorium TaxID=1965070 RepID=A0A3S3S4V5_9ACAR|nr:Lon protease-like protein: peroxisomal [Dinothrombium tinctorium]
MATSSIKLPRRLPLLIIDGVLFPGASIRIPVTSYRNMNMVKSHLLNRSSLSSAIIGVVPKEVGGNIEEDRTNMHPVGTAGIVVQVTGTNWPRPAYTLLVTGLCRFKLESLAQESPYLVGNVKQLDKLPGEDISGNADDKNSELNDLMEQFRELSAKLIDMLDLAVPAVVRLKRLLNSLPVHSLPDVCAAIVRASHEERLQILDAVDLAERFRKTLPLLIRQIEGLRLLQKAKKDGSLGPPTIQIEKFAPLTRQRVDFDDEENEDSDDVSNLEQKIKAADMPEHARKVAMKELQRFKKMPTHMPEHSMTRSYLELMTDLPWSKVSPETIDLSKSKRDLDNDHFGLDKLKRRVLEYLAVRQLKNSLKGPILCFVGPPGVGKTSVGRSIAKSLGREFHRISLGGVCDQADIRGHRRTYIGSMPGRIIQGLRTVGVKNPVFLLDEIDKLSSGIHGDPAAALLEVLDPEQNCAFTDHYLNVAFDLSQVMFIATANTTSTIPPALFDRMEVIHVPGYTHDEKQHIARNHLLPKQLNEHGLNPDLVQFQDEAIKSLISKYTREAGVRGLERKIGALCRAVAVKIVEKNKMMLQKVETTNISENSDTKCDDKHFATNSSEFPIVIDEKAVEYILGPPIFDGELPPRVGMPGVAIGMAWTQTGGEILFVEATKMEGGGQLILTGQLGDVMKESAKIALNWLRNHAHKYDIPIVNGTDLMENTDIHIHFPAGAVGKDGPSAGVTIVTALTSLFNGKVIDPELAMTGEITLRGLVLPVGGIKCKVLAAHRAGIKKIVLPKRNEKDLKDIPASIQADLCFYFVSTIDDVLQVAFEEPFDNLPQKVNIPQISSKL